MAIAEMKKLTLLALKKDKPRLLKTMQRMGCVQVLEKGEEDQSCPDPRSAQRPGRNSRDHQPAGRGDRPAQSL